MKPETEIRGSQPGPELRAAEDGGMPKLTGYPIVFNSWTTIHSRSEGHFREMIRPGAVTKTLREGKPKILFNHGDSPIKELPIAPSKLLADERGVRFDEPPLYMEDEFVRSLVPRLQDGELGSSFRFAPLSEEWRDEHEVEASDENPEGLATREITELKLYEAGPVVWPAYEDATAGVRSLTDEFRRFSYEEMEEQFERWVEERGLLVPEERISDAPWDGAASRFTDEQYERSCVLDRKVCGGEMMEMSPKQRCSLPIKEPGGEINRNAVHAAAARISQVEACPEAISAAKSKLRSAYKAMGEEPPDSLRSEETSETSATNSDKHSPGAEETHSKAGRQDEALYGMKPKQPTWRLPTKE